MRAVAATARYGMAANRRPDKRRHAAASGDAEPPSRNVIACCARRRVGGRRERHRLSERGRPRDEVNAVSPTTTPAAMN